MYVCICRDVTDSQIKEVIDQGASSVKQVCQQLGVGSECGKCACFAKKLIRSHTATTQAES